MPKLLSEFLKEQQEPFSLDAYLIEKGYNLVKRSAKKRRKAVPNCSEIVKAAFRRLILHNNDNTNNNNNQKIKNLVRENKKHEDEDEFSSANGATLSNSCSECSNLFSEEEGDADRKLEWRSTEDSGNKQLSPVSVLEETESDETSPVHENKSRQPKLNHSVKALTYDQYVINKRALQQSKQLLIDCVREVIEDHGKRDKRRQHLKKILDAEELWKLVCENAWLWSQHSIDETNIIHLLHYDFLDSIQGWRSDGKQQKEEISMEIGDAILEGIISEIVTSY